MDWLDRLLREHYQLQMESNRRDQCRYFVVLNSSDMSRFDAYLVGPDTGVYRFKFVKLHVKLPDDFPMVPPEVRFVHHTRHHIHPNLYVSGKMCLGFLG